MTLLILAAGMGSRYGGLKQIDPITDHGEFIIDFSIFDSMFNSLNKEGLVFGAREYPQTLAPSFVSQSASQLPLKPVCPVKKTFFPLYILLNM